MSATTREILRAAAELEARELRERQASQALNIVDARARARTLHRQLARRVVGNEYFIECESRLTVEGSAAFEAAWRDSADERAQRFKRNRVT
jgi:hypothetical protein